MPITRILDNGAILQLQDEDTRGLIVTDLEKGSGIIIEKDTEFVYITYPTTATKQTIDPDLVIDPINTGVDNLFDQIQDYVNNVPTGGMGFTYLAQNFTNLDTVVAPQPITAGELAYVFNSQGTAWLPSTVGGTYYPNGIYVSDGAEWISDRNAIAEQLAISIDAIDQLEADLLQEVQDRTNADLVLQERLQSTVGAFNYNWDLVVDPGVYRGNGNTTNRPDSYNGSETVFVYTTNSGGYIVQLSVNGTGVGLATRRSNDSGATWSSWEIYKSLVLNGFIDYNDTTGGFSITADTWTDLPNNGLGAFTNKNYPPSGVTELIDTSTGYIDPTELDLGDTILIRNDYTINPNTNNAQLKFRYELGNGGGTYTLEKIIGRLDSGSGQNYRFSLTPDLIYMGDTNTRNNPIKLQVYCTSNATVTNSGSVIQVIKR